MNYLNETLRTPIVDEYDVIVCGGGPAGIGASVSAARLGLRTLLVERYGFLGGAWTANLVTPIFDAANKGGDRGRTVREAARPGVNRRAFRCQLRSGTLEGAFGRALL